MSHRVFGKKAELKIQPVGTGLWAVPGSQWGPAEDKTTLEAIETALEAGCNFFDTADVYGGGHSEELLGRAMKGRRDKFVVASKIGWLNYNEEGNRTKYDTMSGHRFAGWRERVKFRTRLSIAGFVKAYFESCLRL